MDKKTSKLKSYLDLAHLFEPIKREPFYKKQPWPPEGVTGLPETNIYFEYINRIYKELEKREKKNRS